MKISKGLADNKQKVYFIGIYNDGKVKSNYDEEYTFRSLKNLLDTLKENLSSTWEDYKVRIDGDLNSEELTEEYVMSILNSNHGIGVTLDLDIEKIQAEGVRTAFDLVRRNQMDRLEIIIGSYEIY